MSDEIKTGHSALGLLMAECEQLRRDLAQAKSENARLAAALDAYERIMAVVVGDGSSLSTYDERLAQDLADVRQVKGQALLDLLAPTIEFLKQDIEWHKCRGWESQMKRAQAVLSQLRAITKQ